MQGIGGGLLERFAYDNEGQLLTGSLMDYWCRPRATYRDIALVHQHSPSPLNPLGVKGLGEGGAIAPPVAIANAVCRRARAVRRGIQQHADPAGADRRHHARGRNAELASWSIAMSQTKTRDKLDPAVVGMPLETILNKYVARFGERKPDWHAFADAAVDWLAPGAAPFHRQHQRQAR